LTTFCDDWIGRYSDSRNRPDQPGSSRISPHLHFGELSPRQCLVAARNAVMDQPAARASADSFVREIGWREFAYHLLHHYPHTTERPLDARFERFPWAENPAVLEAWQRGRTGYPIVDAGMRELWTTGWMHNRVRMIVASFLTKDLLVDWRRGEAFFRRHLADGDPASNNGGWQWAAGCGTDAQPFFRIFNPVLQGRTFDPAAAYVTRWIPELARVAATPAELHAPWTLKSPPADYPAPVVEHAAARAAALAAFATIRRPA
jgi:deoxyribodipyrimidine photo-lyase